MSKEHQIFGQCKDCTWVVVPKHNLFFHSENWGNDPNWTIAYSSNGLVKNHQFEHPGYIPCRISIQCCRNPAFRMRHLSRMVQPPTRYILGETCAAEASASGAFGWVMAVDERRFFRLLKLQAGERFFPGPPVVGRAAIFYYVLTTRSWDFQKLFFGEDEFKETRKRCWILKFYQGFIWGISMILMEARMKIQVNQSTFPLRIWTLEGLHAWTGCFFCENIGRMKASVNICTWYTDALEGLRHDSAYMGTTTSVLQMQQIRYWNGRKLHEKDIQHLLKPLQYC